MSPSLATRLVTAPGLIQAGASCWDEERTPIHPLSLERAYADPELLRDLGAHGARFARELAVDVVVGAETAGVPLAAAVSLAAEVPFAFVRKPGYHGHDPDETPVRGADVDGRRVLLVDDAESSGASAEAFSAELASVGAEVVGIFVLVDMRDVAEKVSEFAGALPMESVTTYLRLLDLATTNGILDAAVHDLSVDALVNHWSKDDARWNLLPGAAQHFSMRTGVATLPVADVDRAKGFYQRLGWPLDIEFTTTQADPLQGLILLVEDIEAARDELERRGIDVSEVWHLEPGQGRVPGRDPERRSYLSRASFVDPDGNTWVLQEVTERLPDGEQMRHSGALAQLLFEASVRRGEFEAVAPPHDWWDWYAAYMEACEQGISQEKAAEAAARHMAGIKRIVVASA